MYRVLSAVLAVHLWMSIDPLSHTLVAGRRIDCTKFVFAPKCRGIAAKRVSDVARESEKQWPSNMNRPAAGWKPSDEDVDRQLQELIHDELQHIEYKMAAQRRRRPSTTWQPERPDTRTQRILARTLRSVSGARKRRW